MVVASSSAVFCLSEVRLGLIPATISPYVIRAISERQARRYFLTAERFDAHEAKRIGLVHEVADDNQLDHEVGKFTHALLSCSPHAMDEAKRLIRDVSYAPIDHELIAETVRRIADIRSSEQGKEGVQAFLQKRKPNWLVDITHDK
jgi:methylglutaconyl-CoA hydratase